MEDKELCATQREPQDRREKQSVRVFGLASLQCDAVTVL